MSVVSWLRHPVLVWWHTEEAETVAVHFSFRGALHSVGWLLGGQGPPITAPLASRWGNMAELVGYGGRDVH